MKYKYNEKEYGKAMFENGFQSDFIRYELVVLVKYLKFIDYKKKDTEVFLYSFCEKYIPSFNKVKYYKVIDGAIRDGRRRDNKLIEVKEITLMKNEMEYIDGLDIDQEYKKLLLGFLVRKKIALAINQINNSDAKLSTYFGGGKKGFREIFISSNIKSGYKIDEMITTLVRKGIVISVIKGDIVLEYINQIPEGGEVYEVIKDFDNIGWVFDYYKGVNNIGKCQECGQLMQIRGKYKLYCTDCGKEKEKTRKREWKRNSKDIGSEV